jgi:apolipoprotein N-acyltransferase
MERLAGRVILLWGWRRALVAFLAGALLVLVQAPYDFFAAGFVSFPILVWLLDGATPDRPRGVLRRLRPAFATGFFFGFGYFIAGLWWVGAAFLVDGGAYAWAMPIGVFFLPAVLAAFWGAASAVARLVWSDGIGRIAMLAATFAVAEWLRGWVLTGFPWNAVGYGVMPIPLLMQPARLVGMDGMNALAVFAFSLPALLGGRRHLGLGLAALVLLAGVQSGFGYWTLTKDLPADGARTLEIRIIQTSVAQDERWDEEGRRRDFQTLLDATVAPPAEGGRTPLLVLWPETAVPYLLTQQGKAVVALGETLADGQTLITGAVRVERAQSESQKDSHYNAAMVIDDRGEIVDAVDKVHLVPGGEYLPLENLFAAIGIDRIVAGPNSFRAGSTHRPFQAAGFSIAPFICYEIIFGHEVWDAARDADFLVNLSNDGWFGDTPGPYQHLRQAQLRAVETGKPMLRAVNLGVSAVIDGKGRILDAFRLDAAGALDATVTVPARTGLSAFDPRLGGLIVVGVLAALGLGLSVRQYLRVN